MKKNNTLSHASIMSKMDRRSFLKLSGMLGLGLASASIIPATAEAVKFDKNSFKVSKTKLAMGPLFP